MLCCVRLIAVRFLPGVLWMELSLPPVKWKLSKNASSSAGILRNFQN